MDFVTLTILLRHFSPWKSAFCVWFAYAYQQLLFDQDLFFFVKIDKSTLFQLLTRGFVTEVVTNTEYEQKIFANRWLLTADEFFP